MDKLEGYGIGKVAIDDLRNTLNENRSIPPKYRAYLEEYIDCLEEKLPHGDYRVFNGNIERYQINN